MATHLSSSTRAAPESMAADARSLVIPSFVKVGAGIVLAGAALTLLTALQVAALSEVDGYPLESSLIDPLRILLAVFLFATVLCFNVLGDALRSRWASR